MAKDSQQIVTETELDILSDARFVLLSMYPRAAKYENKRIGELVDSVYVRLKTLIITLEKELDKTNS